MKNKFLSVKHLIDILKTFDENKPIFLHTKNVIENKETIIDLWWGENLYINEIDEAVVINFSTDEYENKNF